jgi:SRSO17 transposase
MNSSDGNTKIILGDCEISTGLLAPLVAHLVAFAGRYQPHFVRSEQRKHCLVVLEGLLGAAPRKTLEPIATEHDLPRRPIQRFVGSGKWDDETVMTELRQHVVEELGEPDGVITLDSSGFAKKGDESCGVKRQWCGRVGKKDNCQVGMYLGYATSKGHTLVDHELLVPRDWCEDAGKRLKCDVPPELAFRPSWEVATDMLARHGKELPHRWVAADAEFGKSGDFRARMRIQGEQYVAGIPTNRLIRPLNAPFRHSREKGKSGKKKPLFRQVKRWVDALPANRFRSVWIRDGEKGPVEVLALVERVQTKHKGRVGGEETLLVTKHRGSSPEWQFWLTNGDASLEELVRVAASRHTIEEDFERAKGEAGMAHYEVRSYVGWHHHMTLVVMALFFLVLEQRGIAKKNLP